MANYDLSNKDRKYFIDGNIYNCPFCNRRHIKYEVSDRFSFWWTREKMCFGYIVKCKDCLHASMHLSHYNLVSNYGSFSWPLEQRIKSQDDFGSPIVIEAP